jgi:hypothetical protein
MGMTDGDDSNTQKLKFGMITSETLEQEMKFSNKSGSVGFE